MVSREWRKVSPKRWSVIVVTLAYTLITVSVTYPVAFRLSSARSGYQSGRCHLPLPSHRLGEGEWSAIRFHVQEGCERPNELFSGRGDFRCLSILFQGVDILPAQIGKER